MGLPSATRDLGIRHDNTTGECRDAALYVADQLGDECRTVLEALGLIGYVGYEIRTGHRIRVWRQGAVTQ